MIAAPAGWRGALVDAWQRRGWPSRLLRPLAWLYGLLVRLRRELYRRGWLRSAGVPVPVIVVGNVVAGGAGKTPVVLAVVRHLLARGLRPGVLARGYGRSTRDCREVGATARASETGDEALLIKQASGVPVYVARRRIDAARALLARYPTTDVLVCDDGLQHLALRRDIDICVFDERGAGNGLLLPAGPLREPWPRPVDLLVLGAPCPELAGWHATRAVHTARRADGRRVALASLRAADTPALLAVAGIARPRAFFDMLRAHGLPLAHAQALPDHFDFAGWTPPLAPPYTLLCTEKDAVKLWPRFPDALAVELELTLEPGFFAALERLLAAARSARLSS